MRINRYKCPKLQQLKRNGKFVETYPFETLMKEIDYDTNILVISLFISVWLFFIFSQSLIKKNNLLLCASILFQSSLIIFSITTLNSFLARLSVSTSVNSSGICLVCLFGTFSSIASFFPPWESGLLQETSCVSQ